jgi:hypothetical protein
MSISINRQELISAIKELNSSGITEKIKTKDLLEFPLLIMFLEAVESVPEGSPEEEDIPQSVIKYYNRMARKVEKMNSQSIMDYIESGTKIPEKTSKEITDIVDFVEKKEEVTTKSKLKQITDIMETVIDGSKKDIFGLNISGSYHPILEKLVKGKSEGFLVKKDIADKNEIKTAIDKAKKKNPGLVVTKECIDGKFFYKFYGEKSFWEARK